MGGLRLCPIVSSGQGSLEPCLEEKCALWVEEAGRCCFWMLVFHLERLRVELADLAVTVEAK